MLSRAEELRRIEEFIENRGITRLEPFDEDQARKKWRLREDGVGLSEKPRRADS